MDDGLGVEVRGYAELAAGTAMLARRIDDASEQAFAMVAEQAAGGARAAVPRRTGATAASVGVYRSGGAVGPTMGAGVPWAPFVEYGGRGHPHSSQGNYLYPAAVAAEPLLVAAAEATARKEIGGMSWPSPTL